MGEAKSSSWRAAAWCSHLAATTGFVAAALSVVCYVVDMWLGPLPAVTRLASWLALGFPVFMVSCLGLVGPGLRARGKAPPDESSMPARSPATARRLELSAPGEVAATKVGVRYWVIAVPATMSFFLAADGFLLTLPINAFYLHALMIPLGGVAALALRIVWERASALVFGSVFGLVGAFFAWFLVFMAWETWQWDLLLAAAMPLSFVAVGATFVAAALHPTAVFDGAALREAWRDGT